MKTITLCVNTAKEQATYGTFGIFYDSGIPFAVSMEPPIGKRILSVGSRLVTPYLSPKTKKNVFLIHDVAGHSGVEIHTGVFPKHTLGCIVIGESFENLTFNGYTGDGLAYSSHAFFELVSRVGGLVPFILKIIEA